MSDRNRGRIPRITDLLRVQMTDYRAGRATLAATYPSSRPGVGPHTATFRDDGSAIGCTCPAGERGVHCWHLAASIIERAIIAWHRQQHADDSDAQLRAWVSSTELYLTFPLDAEERAAAEYQAEAIAALLRERTRAA